MLSFLKSITNRFKLCWKLLFGSYKHFVILNVSKEQFAELEKYDFPGEHHVANVEVKFSGLQKHQVFQLLEYSYKHMDFAEMVLSKAEFQAKVFEKFEKNI